MLFTCGIWLGFVYCLQFANVYSVKLVKVIMALPIIIVVIFAKPYYKQIKESK